MCLSWNRLLSCYARPIATAAAMTRTKLILAAAPSRAARFGAAEAYGSGHGSAVGGDSGGIEQSLPK